LLFSRVFASLGRSDSTSRRAKNPVSEPTLPGPPGRLLLHIPYGKIVREQRAELHGILQGADYSSRPAFSYASELDRAERLVVPKCQSGGRLQPQLSDGAEEGLRPHDTGDGRGLCPGLIPLRQLIRGPESSRAQEAADDQGAGGHSPYLIAKGFQVRICGISPVRQHDGIGSSEAGPAFSKRTGWQPAAGGQQCAHWIDAHELEIGSNASMLEG
jgi:hypothetical protein